MKYLLVFAVTAILTAMSAGAFAGPQSDLRVRHVAQQGTASELHPLWQIRHHYRHHRRHHHYHHHP